MPASHRRQFSWYRLLPFVPPSLLCLVAIVQIYLVDTHGLSPWKGGGFGMFSTSDADNRQIRVVVEDATGRRVVPVPPALRDEAFEVALFPAKRRLDDLGRKVGAAMEGPPVRRVGVKVLRVDYDPETMAPRLAVVMESEVTIPVPRGDR